MSKVLELLGENGERWLKWAMAQDILGGCVGSLHPGACKWCFLGALIKCYGYDDGGVAGGTYAKVMAVIVKRYPNAQTVHNWNDVPGRKWEEVRDVIVEAGV